MTRRALYSCPALCAVLFSMTACGSDDSPGELENGYFGYTCTTDRDPICGPDTSFPQGESRTMPNLVAVGGTFGVAFRAGSSAAQDGSAVIQAVSSDLLTGGGGLEPVFTAVKPGFAGLLAMRGSTVVDVIHVHITPIARARIDATAGTSGSVVVGVPEVSIGSGALVELSAAAADGNDATLAGSLDYAWATDDSAVAEILSSPSTDEITVRGGQPGQTKVRVTIGGVSGEVSVVVPASAGGEP